MAYLKDLYGGLAGYSFGSTADVDSGCGSFTLANDITSTLFRRPDLVALSFGDLLRTSYNINHLHLVSPLKVHI